ncbi:hypothetical protein RJ640_020319 [Escallonia rubra]|uniref:Cytochrome P450 n=1 Tax=Escallonia rubra TaxID=112253 RepID=A0AA88US53_9ASTE|nr:hypothetical protein RJ640_020319 [Escallonia rubra]
MPSYHPISTLMEFLNSNATATTAGIFAFLVCLHFVLRKNNGRKNRAPAAAGAWPLVGHLRLLRGPQLPHVVLGSMADKYGPIFRIRLGVFQALVVSDWKIAKECLTTNDKAFSNRPKSVAVEVMGYNYAMFGLGPYGSYWRQMRKISILELLSNHRVGMLEQVRESEVQASIKDIYDTWKKNKGATNILKMEMQPWFGRLALKMAVRMLAGKRYSCDEHTSNQSHDALRKFFELSGTFTVTDAIPHLRWLDMGGYEKAMTKTAKEIDSFLGSWLEHKRKRASGQVKDEQKDFLDVMLSTIEGAASKDDGGFDVDTIIKSTCLVLLAGSSDSSMVTLTWALALLLNNNHVLKKAQAELDIHVGRKRQVQESDLKNLVYLQAIVKEALRLYPPTALMPARESMEDCVVGGYNIPKGTRLVVNLWKIHRDPSVWPDPSEFRPERFLTSHKDVDVRGQHFELIPFGSGRRICPGISLGLRVVHFTLASLIHGFEIKKPSDEPVDMTGSFGLTNMKATPLHALLAPRLSFNLVVIYKFKSPFCTAIPLYHPISRVMEFLNSYATATTAGSFAFLVCLHYVLWRNINGRKKRAPAAAGAWPLVGHLPLLSGPQLPHVVLGSMADKYGPIFRIKLGVLQELVVSDWKIAKECFTTNDMAFSNRPKSVAVEVMGYNYAMFGLGPYGSYWRQMRKISMLELLSNHRVGMLVHVRESEVQASIKDIYDTWKKNEGATNILKMEMKPWFGRLTLNMVVRMLAGKQNSCDEHESARTREALRGFLELAGTFTVSDAIPCLRWLDMGGYEKAMRKNAKEIDYFLEGWLKDHKRKRASGQVKDEQKDFLDVMLSTLEGASSKDDGGFDVDTIIKSTCLVFLTGATDTSTVTLTWALALLLNHNHVLEKAQAELDSHVGRKRQVQESDLKNLVYLQAIIKETLRLYPPAALLPARESMEDCMVGGYNIPKGTRLVVNLWKIHRDPSVWSDPCEFQPERFLKSHKDFDVRGQHFELIPFGSGRRICPGITLGLQVVHFILASLIHGFEIKKPSDEPVDMTESFGMSNMKATPLHVVLAPRLSSYLYEQITG